MHPTLPQVTVNPELGRPPCRNLEQCRWFRDQMLSKLVGRYIAERAPFEHQIPAARLCVEGLTFEDYVAQVRRKYKGPALRHARKADRKGYFCEPFVYRQYVPDIVEANRSKKERSGRPMSEPYRRGVDQSGGAPTLFRPLSEPDCPVHYDRWWGIFRPEPGHRQGQVTTDQRLLAYIRLRRNGDYALYAQILGHGDYLSSGIMYRLHLAIVEWICEPETALTAGLRNIIYAGFYQGEEGLQLWKKKTLFEPAYLILAGDDTP